MLNDPRIWGTHLKQREVVMNAGKSFPQAGVPTKK